MAPTKAKAIHAASTFSFTAMSTGMCLLAVEIIELLSESGSQPEEGNMVRRGRFLHSLKKTFSGADQ
jgi:hypothetical protein